MPACMSVLYTPCDCRAQMKRSIRVGWKCHSNFVQLGFVLEQYDDPFSAAAGLLRSAVSVRVTSPALQVAMWTWLVWRTPPRSDLLYAPARRRLIVVSLLPKASRMA